VTRAIGMLAFALWLAAAGGVALASPAAEVAAFAFRPHPGALLPLGARLIDENGDAVKLGDFFRGKPVLVVLEYLRCKTFCGLTLRNLIATLDNLPFSAGSDFEMLAIAIDPGDTPTDRARARAKYLALYHHGADGDGIHFLGGTPAAVHRIADTIGFPYRYDPATGQYIHPAGFILAGPDGRISRYLFGVAAAGPELRAALSDAAQDRVIGPLERLVLLCHIDGTPLGRFTVPIVGALMICNIAAGTALIVIFAAIWRRRHHG
jgi:protein SCO1